MSEKPIEIEFDNTEINNKLLELAKSCENLRPFMKNAAGILSYAVEENFKNEGRPEKWVDLSESTKKQRQKIGKWPGQILQVTTQLALSVNTFYDDDSAVIGSNLAYAAIHQLGGKAGKNRKVNIPARPYLKLTEDNLKEILLAAEQFLKQS